MEKNKRFNKLKQNKFKVVFVLLLIIVAAAFFIFKFIFGSSMPDNMSNIPFNGNYENVAAMNGEIYILNEDILKSYDKEGQEKSSVMLPLKNGKLLSEANHLFVYGKENFYILDSKGESVKNIEISFEIEYAKVEDNVIYIIGDKDYQLYNVDGELIVKDKVKDTVSTLALSKKQNNLVYTTLSATDSGIKTDIYLKNIKDNKEISQTFVDEIIMYSNFINDERYLIVSNKQMIVFENFQIINKRMIKDFKDISISGSNIYTLEGDTLNMYDFDLKLTATVSLKSEFSNVYAQGNKAVLLGESSYGYYKSAGDSLVNSKDVEDINGFITNGKEIYLLHTDTVEKIDLDIGE